VSKTTLTIEISGSVDKVAALEDMAKAVWHKELSEQAR